MNTKRLITASIFSLISASTALAADVMIPHQPASSTTSTIVAPTFSWTGLYLGVQAGGFSSKADVALVGQEKSLPLDKEFSPKLSGFVGGFYAGSNIDLGDNFIFGIDTDLMISGKKHTKTITIGAADNTTVENAVVRSRRSASLPTLPSAQEVTSIQTAASGRSASKVVDAGTTPTLAATTQTEQVTSQVGSSKPASTKPASENPTQQLQAGTQRSESLVRTSGGGDVNPKTEVRTPSVSALPSSPSKPAGSVAQQTSSVQSAKLQTGGTSTVVTELNGTAQLTSASKVTVPSTGTRSVQSQSSLRSDKGLALASTVVKGSESLAASNPTSSSTVTGSTAVGSSGARSAKTVEKIPLSSRSSTGTEASQPAVKAPTPVQSVSQPSAEKTVPSSSLVLARSGSSSGSETKASNGTSGAQNGGHHSSSHGSGNANSHGAPHAGGRSSGAHPNGTNPHASRSHGGQNMSGHAAQSTQAVDKNDSSIYAIEQIKKMASELGLDQEDEVETLNHTFKQNWGGATRVRIGFAADRFMPYLAGGIAYGQFQDTVSIFVKDEDGRVVSSKNLSDETKTMIGYTLGGGVDFSVLDNVIVRAEYRYSDFGKKKFAKEKLEVNYKTNDFRVGVAYKF
ncbi:MULTISPECIES: outer membrane beta-barrel protein [unclassified Bartonella]|uniref:outer membrane beta-barrel protein n=1 Tax=unclassified Bartonella TaxID=2645622 RepID=UPI0035CF0AF4